MAQPGSKRKLFDDGGPIPTVEEILERSVPSSRSIQEMSDLHLPAPAGGPTREGIGLPGSRKRRMTDRLVLGLRTYLRSKGGRARRTDIYWFLERHGNLYGEQAYRWLRDVYVGTYGHGLVRATGAGYDDWVCADPH